MSVMKIALCGNPNVGKTTLFNRITHSSAPVGNWHGVTVDVKTKKVDNDAYISDLPGAYSLTARSAEEKITRDQILYGNYDVLVYVAEVNNLRRNLYMFTQLLEADKRCVLVVNMMDEARVKPNLSLLSERLGVPVIGASVTQKNPKTEIIKAAREALCRAVPTPDYLNDVKINGLISKISDRADACGLSRKFAAIKVMENDSDIILRLNTGITHVDKRDVDKPAVLRYAYIDKTLKGISVGGNSNDRTLKIDRLALGKLALPIFFIVMTAVFVLTFEAAKPLSDLLGRLMQKLSVPIMNADIPDWIISLLCDGIIAGAGSVLAFLPQVVILFLLTALLQDSGYMSRVAFVTDGFFKRFGLSGRAAFSVVLGLGCSATAVLSTRGIASESERKRAAFITPFCPCSARLAVFAAIAAYFELSGFVVAAMYVIGCVAALAVLKVMTLMQNKKTKMPAPIIMEMPPYRIPKARRVASVVWHNAISFVGRIGSVVLTVSIIFWVLCNFSVTDGFCGSVDSSLMSSFAGFIAPVFAPLGFGTWQAVAALISGIAAKETVVSVIASLGGWETVLGGSVIAAVSFMIFTCLYVPCVATVSAVRSEAGTKSAVMSVAVQTAAAYSASLVFYQAARLYLFDTTVFYGVLLGGVGLIISITAITHFILKIGRKKRWEKSLNLQ